MNVEIDLSKSKTEATGNQINAVRLRKLALAALAVFTIFLIAPAQPVYLQGGEDLDVSTVIKEIKNRFHLNAGDIKSIRPFLTRENNNFLAIYVRFSEGVEPEYSDRVWQEIIASNGEFLACDQGALTKRQVAALRVARAGIERRIINSLVDDYVDFLGQVLELDKWAYGDVQNLFEADKSKKLQLFNTVGSPDFRSIQNEIERISEGTERDLKRILTETQWRDYKSLTASTTPTA